MIDINVHDISKSYGSLQILKEVSFIINEGEKVSLIGLNGSGKTTLFRILTGQVDYDSGSFYVNPNKTLGYLKQSNELNTEMTIYAVAESVFQPIIQLESEIRLMEQALADSSNDSSKLESLLLTYSDLNEKFEALEGYQYKSKIRGVLNGLGFSDQEFHNPVSQLSGGQKSRVMLAKLLLSSPDILLLDEPTNHLDIQSIEWIEKYITDFKGSVLVISHDRYFLDRTTQKTLFLSQETIKSYRGNYSFFIEKWHIDQQLLQKKYQLQEKEVQRQKEIIAKFLANGRDKKVRQAKSREKMLENMNAIENPHNIDAVMKLRFTPKRPSGYEVLKVDNISKHFDSHKVFDNVSFEIYRGERVGLIGPNGVGKSTLFKMIQNPSMTDNGQITFGHHVEMAYYDQELTDLDNENTVIDEIWDAYPDLKVHEVRGYLAQFMFYSEDLFKTVGDLSGGEKSRLSLLKLMLSDANLLMIDEPTNHLDIDSKDILEKAMINYDGTMIIISHDRYFLNKTVTKIFEMTADGIQEYLGNYDSYHDKKKYLAYGSQEDSPSISKTEMKHKAKKERDLIRQRQAEKKQIKLIEETIQNTEEAILSIESQLCEPEVFNDHEKALSLSTKLEQLKKALDDYFEEWAALHS